MSNVSFSIGALFYIILLLVLCVVKKIGIKSDRATSYESENRVYLVLVIATVVGVFLDCISFIMAQLGHTGDNRSFIFLTKLIFCYYDIWCLIFTLYIITVTLRKKNKLEKLKSYKSVIYSMIPVLILINLLLPIKIEIIEGAMFPTGISVYLCYILALVAIAYLFYILMKNRTLLKNREYFPLWILMIASTVMIIIQYLVPGLILMTAMEALVTFIMYFTIENPDMKMIEQLETARNQAERANSAKTDFLSSMSHEIRTPLNAIVGFSDYIVSSESLAEAKENAKDIINASNTLLEIVNGILDISKIEAGKLEIVNSRYKAKATFEALAKLITPRMYEKGLDFSFYIAPDIPDTLYGDHANLKKIVTNLLSNACKYTDKGSVRYEVNCINSAEVTKLIITVEDTGRGIKPTEIDKLFTKFQRLDEDKNSTIEGTGLGLAITKDLIEMMGGKILVHTVYGEGSKFTVVLNQRIEEVPLEEKVAEQKTTLDLKGKKILMVDDNPMNLKVGTKILERFNADSIVTLDSGFKCIEHLKTGEVYDIILLDDMMPKMSGSETLVELRKIPGFNQPVVMLTANAIAGMKEKYIREGFDEYLAKPIEKQELIRVCNLIFEKNKNKQNNEPVVEAVPVKNEEIVENLDEDVEQLEVTGPIQVVQVPEEVLEDTPVVKTSSEEFLINQGVNLDKALEVLGDMEMYNMTIGDFLDEVEEKWHNIESYKSSGDMPNYAIEVHSLKSDSKYLGFMALADVAYEHELKSKADDKEYVEENFKKLEVEYIKALETAKRYNSMINKD